MLSNNCIGIIAAIGICLVLGLLRISQAETLNDYIFALSLTSIEVGLVLTIEHLAVKHQKLWRTYNEQNAIATIKRSQLAAATSRLYHCQQQQNLQGQIQHHLQYIDFFNILRSREQEIEDTTVKASLAGYHAGIAYINSRFVSIKEGTDYES